MLCVDKTPRLGAERLVTHRVEEAFIIEFDVNSVKGGVLRRYLNKKKGKKLANFIAEHNL